MAKKTNYRVRNWAQYNKALVNRGNITVWFNARSAQKWFATPAKGKPGRNRVYSDEAILCMLTIRSVFKLPLRASCGLMTSLISAMSLTLPVPCYTNICRRAKGLGKLLEKLISYRGKPKHIVFDSSGLKVYGEGEWKVRTHGTSKRRTWRKAHFAVCPETHQVVMGKLTESRVTDASVLEKMADKLPESVNKAYADGAYDQEGCYASLHKKGIALVVPPRKDARVRDSTNKPWLESRNSAVKAIKSSGNNAEARKAWKISQGYHKRSLVETAMYRFKTFFTGRLASRNTKNQKVELLVKSLAMNSMTKLGMPQGSCVKS